MYVGFHMIMTDCQFNKTNFKTFSYLVEIFFYLFSNTVYSLIQY